MTKVFADRSIPSTLIIETASAKSISTKQGSLYSIIFICSNDKHPHDFIGPDSNPINCAASCIAAGAVTC
jgi:hypothetical protein